MKKTILAAVDFSKGSLRALKYAISIANKIDANVLMCWVLKPDNDSIFVNSSDKLIAEAKKRFDELVKKHEKDLKNGKLEYKIRKGKVHVEIANQAKYSDVSMIIAGTHGISGFEEHWLGSNARRIVTSAPCPVLTMRYDYCHTNKIKKMALPIDVTISSRQKVPLATELAKIFDAEIHVIATANSKADKRAVSKYCEQVHKYLKDNGIKYKKAETNKKPSEIIEYAQSADINLIVIMTEQEPSTISLLLGASAEQVVTHSPIPVLSVHTKELYSTTARL